MLKFLRAATALSIIGAATTAFAATALAQDSGCYMRTASGSVVNLSRLCHGQSEAAPVFSPTSKPNQGVFQVPIKRRAHGIPVLDVTFNGNQTFEMMMDSGASVTVLTPQIASSLGVVPIGKAKVNTSSARDVEQGVGKVRSIDVGGATIHNAYVLIAGPELEAGLLGENFLRHYDVTIKQNIVEFRVRASW